MEEMRMLIARRGHTGRTRSMSDQAQSHMDQLKPALRNMNEQVSEIEDRIAQAIANHERCVADVQAILQDNENVSPEQSFPRLFSDFGDT
jgi:phage shock protein A